MIKIEPDSAHFITNESDPVVAGVLRVIKITPKNGDEVVAVVDCVDEYDSTDTFPKAVIRGLKNQLKWNNLDFQSKLFIVSRRDFLW